MKSIAAALAALVVCMAAEATTASGQGNPRLSINGVTIIDGDGGVNSSATPTIEGAADSTNNHNTSGLDDDIDIYLEVRHQDSGNVLMVLRLNKSPAIGGTFTVLEPGLEPGEYDLYYGYMWSSATIPPTNLDSAGTITSE